jgi:hypothetical protein
MDPGFCQGDNKAGMTWIPFSNGMTDAVVHHLDTGRQRILSKSKGRHGELN